MLLNRINEFTDTRMNKHRQQCNDLKKTLRNLRTTSRDLKEKIQTESRKGNKKILHEKLKIVDLQRRKGLSMLKNLRKTNLSII